MTTGRHEFIKPGTTGYVPTGVEATFQYLWAVDPSQRYYEEAGAVGWEAVHWDTLTATPKVRVLFKRRVRV